MHQQIRTVPAQSPADLGAFLKVLRDANINIIAAGGGDVERGGEFAFAVEDGGYDAAMQALTDAGYKPRLVDVDHELLPDVPGALHGFVTKVTALNKARNWVIWDVSVGSAQGGKVLVQIYSKPA